VIKLDEASVSQKEAIDISKPVVITVELARGASLGMLMLLSQYRKWAENDQELESFRRRTMYRSSINAFTFP
jgi:hypothetical protein